MPKVAKFRHLLQFLQFTVEYYDLHKLTAGIFMLLLIASLLLIKQCCLTNKGTESMFRSNPGYIQVLARKAES